MPIYATYHLHGAIHHSHKCIVTHYRLRKGPPTGALNLFIIPSWHRVYCLCTMYGFVYIRTDKFPEIGSVLTIVVHLEGCTEGVAYVPLLSDIRAVIQVLQLTCSLKTK